MGLAQRREARQLHVPLQALQSLFQLARRFIGWAGLAFALASPCLASDWFEDFKKSATPDQLYAFLYALPKGGDLHNHLTGAARSEWIWDATLAQEKRGYVNYTKVAIHNCVPYGGNEYGRAPYMLLFRNLLAANYAKLNDCQKSEYKRLQDLDARGEGRLAQQPAPRPSRMKAVTSSSARTGNG